jgi:hypothetical protein
MFFVILFMLNTKATFPMKNIDHDALIGKQFKTIDELKDAILSQNATTTDLGFILSLRNTLIESDESLTSIDAFLWQLMREHSTLEINGNSLFITSCIEGSVYWFDQLISSADKLDKDMSGHTAPFHAVISGNLYILKKLKEEGFDFINVSKDKKSLLKESASSPNPRIFEWLLSETDDAAELEDTLTEFVLNHDDYEITNAILKKGIDYDKCRIKTEKIDLDLASIAIYRQKINALRAIIDNNINTNLPFDDNDDDATVKALLGEEETLDINKTISRNYAKFVITNKCEFNKEKIKDYIQVAKTSHDINFICICADIQPMFDLNIDEYSDEIQSLIYEAMVI